jgi:hypothetical protein
MPLDRFPSLQPSQIRRYPPRQDNDLIVIESAEAAASFKRNFRSKIRERRDFGGWRVTA